MTSSYYFETPHGFREFILPDVILDIRDCTALMTVDGITINKTEYIADLCTQETLI